MKIFFLTLLSIFYLNSFAQYNFRIEGKAPNIFNGKKIYLGIMDNYSQNKYEFKDSSLVDNNEFQFRGILKKISEKAHLYSKEPNGYFRIVVDSGLNKIEVNTLKPKTPFFKNKLSNSEVLHSESNRILRQLDSLTNYYYLTKAKASQENKNLLVLSESNRNSLRKSEYSILKNNPNIFYSLIYLYDISSSRKRDELQEVYDILNEDIKNSPLGVEFNETLALKKGVEIGSKVKEFTAQKINDSVFSNKSLMGKTYLLAFGATWCIPCKERIPFLLEKYNKYKPKGLEVVYVNLDDKKEKWKKQISTNNSKWINVSENLTWKESKIAKLFDVTSLPFYLIIDKTGTIIYNEKELKDIDLKAIENYITTALR